MFQVVSPNSTENATFNDSWQASLVLSRTPFYCNDLLQTRYQPPNYNYNQTITSANYNQTPASGRNLSQFLMSQ